MDVICSTAFGIEVDSQKDPQNRFVHYAKQAATRNIGGPFILFISNVILFDVLLSSVGSCYSWRAEINTLSKVGVYT